MKVLNVLKKIGLAAIPFAAAATTATPIGAALAPLMPSLVRGAEIVIRGKGQGKTKYQLVAGMSKLVLEQLETAGILVPSPATEDELKKIIESEVKRMKSEGLVSVGGVLMNDWQRKIVMAHALMEIARQLLEDEEIEVPIPSLL